MNADRLNYALISALYASKTRGLYSDIYFPIIKYAILMLYSRAKSREPYLSSQDVHDEIARLFYINSTDFEAWRNSRERMERK